MIAETVIIPFLLLVLLLCPRPASDGVRAALQLWLTGLIPSLLPALLLTRLLFRLPAFLHLPPAAGVIILGYIGGFPLGAITAADYVSRGRLSQKEAQLLVNHCNQPGPAFLVSYVTKGYLTWLSPVISLVCVYGPSLLLLAGEYFSGHIRVCRSLPARQTAESKKPFLRRLEEDFTSCCEALVRIGLYLMLFSVLIQYLVQAAGLPPDVTACLAGLLEVTSGLPLIASLPVSRAMRTILALAACSFGGLSFLFQTASYILPQGLSIVSYVKKRVLCTAVTVLALLLAAGIT